MRLVVGNRRPCMRAMESGRFQAVAEPLAEPASSRPLKYHKLYLLVDLGRPLVENAHKS
jgi:hypothetical protein